MVDCQLDSLGQAKTQKKIYHILRNLPADLNSMYERILQSVKAEDENAVQIVQCMLWWLVGSLQQLCLVELMEAVMVETGRDLPNMDLRPLSGEHLLEMCSSLVCYDTETDILTLPHASVQVQSIIIAINIRFIVLARIFYFLTISREWCTMTIIFHHSHSYTDIPLA